MADRLFRKEEALELLRVSRPTLDRIIARGELPIVRLSGRTVRIAETALRELVEQRTERRGDAGSVSTVESQG
jgi:excisionase family DNA binding protein